MIFPKDIPLPDINMTEQQTENITRNKFGDGYEQRTENGVINNRFIKLSLTWTLPYDEGMEFWAWLKEVKNITSFLWTAPDDYERKYLCTDAKRTHGNIKFTITATFEQVFDI